MKNSCFGSYMFLRLIGGVFLIVVFSDDVFLPTVVNKFDIIELRGLNQEAIVFGFSWSQQQVV